MLDTSTRTEHQITIDDSAAAASVAKEEDVFTRFYVTKEEKENQPFLAFIVSL